MKRVLLALLLGAVNQSCQCAAPPVIGEGEGEGDLVEPNACVTGDGPGFKLSAKADLRWKRVNVLKNDLERALDLDDTLVCSELGLRGTCFNLIHTVPLGGNDPVKSGTYRPIASPGVTTSLSLDRVVLSACGLRADAEELGALEKVVWPHIDFTAASLNHDDPNLQDDVQGLYQRLLGRDPNAEEMTLTASLADDVNGVPTAPRDFAKMACYAVATTSEFLFN